MRTRRDGWAAVLFLAAAAAILMICSMNSWLYPLNPWSDVNILGTMGREMLNGQVPYRDLFDHKGPLIYFLFGLCMNLMPGTYHGLFLLEVLCCAGAMFFGWKTARLYLPDLSPLWVVPLFALLAGSDWFGAGASVEELLLFPMAWSLYDLLAAWRGGKPLTSGALLRNGVLAGCVLWTKFNLLSFHFVWMAAAAIDALVRERKLWPTVKMCLIFLGGMALATLPWMVYFGANGAIGDLIDGYFASNLFEYGAEGGRSWLGNLAYWTLDAARRAPVCFILLALSMVSVLAVPRSLMAVREKAMLLCAAALLAASMFSRSMAMSYYATELGLFFPFALLPLKWLRRRGARSWPRWTAAAAAVLVLAGSTGAAYALCGFAGGIGTPYGQTAQAQIAEIIRDSGIEDPTLVQYRSMDTGVYYASGARPAHRRYTGTNIQRDAYLAEIQQLIDGGVPDFVVTLLFDPEDIPELERYARVAVIPTDYGSGSGDVTYYCLYQRIEEV